MLAFSIQVRQIEPTVSYMRFLEPTWVYTQIFHLHPNINKNHTHVVKKVVWNLQQFSEAVTEHSSVTSFQLHSEFSCISPSLSGMRAINRRLDETPTNWSDVIHGQGTNTVTGFTSLMCGCNLMRELNRAVSSDCSSDSSINWT